jgi:hypothetical protein
MLESDSEPERTPKDAVVSSSAKSKSTDMGDGEGSKALTEFS